MTDLKTCYLAEAKQFSTEWMNILFSHFEIKSSAAGEVEKAKLWTKKCTTLHSYVRV